MTRLSICKEAFKQMTAGVADYKPTTTSFGTIHHYWLSDNAMVSWLEFNTVGKVDKYYLTNFEQSL